MKAGRRPACGAPATSPGRIGYHDNNILKTGSKNLSPERPWKGESEGLEIKRTTHNMNVNMRSIWHYS